jgi:hypothetical protein
VPQPTTLSLAASNLSKRKNLCQCLAKNCALKKGGEVEVQFHVILICTLGTGEWPVSLPGTRGYQTLGAKGKKKKKEFLPSI